MGIRGGHCQYHLRAASRGPQHAARFCRKCAVWTTHECGPWLAAQQVASPGTWRAGDPRKSAAAASHGTVGWCPDNCVGPYTLCGRGGERHSVAGKPQARSSMLWASPRKEVCSPNHGATCCAGRTCSGQRSTNGNTRCRRVMSPPDIPVISSKISEPGSSKWIV